MLLAVILALVAWRLAQGPVDVSWLTARLENALNTPDSPAQVHIGHTALAWEGFRLGVDHPIDLRLTDVSVTDAAGHQRLAVPLAKVSLSFEALLKGQVQPRAIELDGPRVLLQRAADGGWSLDLGGPDTAAPAQPGSTTQVSSLLAELARPPATDRSAMRGWISQIRRVRIRDAAVTVQDRPDGVTWHAPRAALDLTRGSQGGVSGSADMLLALQDQQARLHATVSLSPAASETRLSARLSPVRPAALARLVPSLAPLAALDAPVVLSTTVQLGPTLQLQHFRVQITAEAGTAHLLQSSVPILSASLTADGTPDAVRIDAAQVRLRGDPAAPITTLDASGNLQRGNDHVDGNLSLRLDQLAFADLPQLWPVGVGGGARTWLTRNITAGLARNGQVQVAFTARQDLSRFTLTAAQGTLDGTGLTVHWLRPVPPIVDGTAQLRILDPDTLAITVLGGRQTLRNAPGGLTIAKGSMTITGLMRPDQFSSIQAQVTGPVRDALALLREPRLHLLADHPMRLDNPSGQAEGVLQLQVPLEARVTMDQIPIHATAHLTDLHLDGVAAGRSLDQGTLDMDVTDDGLTLAGQARLAGIPASLKGAMDFRAGPPSQVVERISLAGRPDARQLAAAGLDATDLLSGPVPLQVELASQRNGVGTLSVQADLTPASLQVAQLDWHKPAGTAAQAQVQLRLLKDRLDAINRFAVTGTGLSVQGSAECRDGRVSLVRLDRLVLGRTDLHGTVRLPAAPRGAYAVALSGPELDLSQRLQRKPTSIQAPPPATSEPPPGPAWTLDGRFDRVLMAHDFLLAPVTVQAENDGRVMRQLSVTGDTRAHGPFALHITPQAGGRRLTASAAQAGDLLRALNWLDTMQQGRLSLEASYDDSQPDHPLQGKLELNDFRVREAAGLGKLLQAMTLYGLVDALRGPGLVFSRAVVPFRLAGGQLQLTDARAFSSSLGLTAKGQIDLDARRVDMQGTIVPAYFFNSLLGHLPLVGKLLSPEQGGGVFAASYTLRGKLDDPDVAVNPLTALTPGFLRGLFGGF